MSGGRSLRVRGRSGFRCPQPLPSWASIVSGNSPCLRRARSPSPPQRRSSIFRRSCAPSPDSVHEWHTVKNKRPRTHHRSIRHKLHHSHAPPPRRLLPRDFSCYRCGEIGHYARDCRNARVCSVCKQIGHSARHCNRGSLRPIRQPQSPPLRSKPTKAASPSFGTAYSPLHRPGPHPKSLLPSTAVPLLSPAPSSVCLEFSPTMVSNYKNLRSKAIISVSEENISPLQLEISLRRLWGREWTWIALPLSSYEFLISFPSHDLMLEQVKVHRFHIDGFSLSVRRWSADHRAYRGAATKESWLKLDGLPLFCWEPADVASIVSGIGKLRRLHSRTAAKDDLISAVALVDVFEGSSLPNYLDLHIGAFSYKIRVSSLPTPVKKPPYPPLSRRNSSAPSSSRTPCEKGKGICFDPLVPSIEPPYPPSVVGLLAPPSTAVPSHVTRTTPNPPRLSHVPPLHLLGSGLPVDPRELLPPPTLSHPPSSVPYPDTLMPRPLALDPLSCFDPMLAEASFCPSSQGPLPSSPLLCPPNQLATSSGLHSNSAHCDLNLLSDSAHCTGSLLTRSPIRIASSQPFASLDLVNASCAPLSAGHSPATSPPSSSVASPSLINLHPFIMMPLNSREPGIPSCPLAKKRGLRSRSLTAPPTATRRSARLIQDGLADTTNAKCARRAAVRALEIPPAAPSLSNAASAASLGSPMQAPSDEHQGNARLLGSLPDSLFYKISSATGLLLGDNPSATISQVRGLEQLHSSLSRS